MHDGKLPADHVSYQRIALLIDDLTITFGPESSIAELQQQ
jgi:hypothetical protein